MAEKKRMSPYRLPNARPDCGGAFHDVYMQTFTCQELMARIVVTARELLIPPPSARQNAHIGSPFPEERLSLLLGPKVTVIDQDLEAF
jgi:hypothetical protein